MENNGDDVFPESFHDELLLMEGDSTETLLNRLPGPGYLEVYVGKDGSFRMRGTREWLTGLTDALAASGWHIRLDALQWCG